MRLFVCQTWEIIAGQHESSISSGVRIWKLYLSEYRRPQCATCRALAAVFHFSISASLNNLCLTKASPTESPLEYQSKGWERCTVIQPLFTTSIEPNCLRICDLPNNWFCLVLWCTGYCAPCSITLGAVSVSALACQACPGPHRNRNSSCGTLGTAFPFIFSPLPRQHCSLVGCTLSPLSRQNRHHRHIWISLWVGSRNCAAFLAFKRIFKFPRKACWQYKNQHSCNCTWSWYVMCRYKTFQLTLIQTGGTLLCTRRVQHSCWR